MDKGSHYPGFDVLQAQDAWDETTRNIVLKRLAPSTQRAFLRPEEERTLAALIEHLLFESRPELKAYVLAHIDNELCNPIGESERKAGMPPQAALVRNGLFALDAVARYRHSRLFHQCDTAAQFQMVAALQNGQLEALLEWQAAPQRDFFNKLLTLTVESYAAHPTVWSEMGYAGPAYPRGYYHIELNIRDAWEPEPARRQKEERRGEHEG